MQKINWENGTLISPAKVEIGGVIYEVTPEQYSGNTPLSAENFNLMQTNMENAFKNSYNTSTVDGYSCDYVNDKIEELTTYSTNEQEIGTWIDGKPLYRKLYKLATTSNSATIDISDLSYENVFIKNSWFILGATSTDTSVGKYVINPFYNSSSDYARTMILNTAKIQLQSTETASKLWYVIIEYTKTTD